MIPFFIDAAGSPRTGGFHPRENPSIEIPVHRVHPRFGTRSISTDALAMKVGAYSVLGGALVQQAAAHDLDCLFHVFLSDVVRALGTAARSKRRTVLILGSFSEAGRERLAAIRSALEQEQLEGVKLDDFADIHQQSTFERMLMFGSLAGFIVCDEFLVSGHLIELKACSDIGFVTAILRHQGKPVTWVNSDIAAERSFMKIFRYDDEQQIGNAVREAVAWAQEEVAERVEFYNTESIHGEIRTCSLGRYIGVALCRSDARRPKTRDVWF